MVMSEWDGTAWAGSDPIQVRSDPEDSLAGLVSRMTGLREMPWRLPTIEEALGVPAIQRAVTLIANTVGSLTIQTFRNRGLYEPTPQVVARPDPFNTPRTFQRDTAWNLATRGEFVWWIANFDADGWPIALINVPLHELTVEENQDNRLFPEYAWGDFKGTRWSPVNRRGRFVHETYARHPGALRGVGPLQMGKAAVSVAVESQEWAANFYADGGYPSLLIKHGGQLSPVKLDPDTYEPDPDGYNEAEILRQQWMDKPHNVPRVIDQTIESVTKMDTDQNGAQMLQSRDYSNGDAARMFGIPGALLEYGHPGASLTYQNLADVWINFTRGCLAPNYLEPIEQAMSDLLPRSTTARFLTSGLQRTDDKTRWEIYQIAVTVLGAEQAAQLAQVAEGLTPGNPEVAPIPFAPPAAIPASLPEVRVEAPAPPVELEVRCDGMHTRRQHGTVKLSKCNALLSKTGTYVGICRRCKKEHNIVAEVA